MTIELRLEMATYSYRGGRTGLRDVTLTLGDGATAIVGENGAGKSTLLEVLAGLKTVRSGRYLIDGLDVAKAPGAEHLRRQISYLPQSTEQPRHMQVLEALYFAAWLARIPRQKRSGAVHEVLRELELEEYATIPLGSLSGGLRQRVRIAQALVGDRPVLVFDEPTTAVDAQHRGEIRKILASVAATRLVIFSTHMSEDLEFLADRVVVLSRGKLAGDMSPSQLRTLGTGSDDALVGPYERALTLLHEGVHN